MRYTYTDTHRVCFASRSEFEAEVPASLTIEETVPERQWNFSPAHLVAGCCEASKNRLGIALC